jgi:LuxR family maltose regulon positive regulatory protein
VVPRPLLLARVGGAARVTVVAAPAGSGKTVLLRSWMDQEGLDGRVAWVPVGRGERDPLQFWVLVVGALRATTPGSALVAPLTAAPDTDGGMITERLLADLAALQDRLCLVVDDVHELGAEALRQLELLIMRAPSQLRFVLAARHEVRLGLHRLRLEGELAEIRTDDLRFTLAEAAELFTAAGVELDRPSLAKLYERTEGWAAGLRLAALALAGHPDPALFAAEFTGSERTVAEYLLAEVLDRQPEPVRRLLLRTSILERVNGELADLLTGDEGGERVLQDLEQAGSFVISLDTGRSWFRYHQMFADLLRLELRRTTPGDMAGLHCAAAGWLATHRFGVEAIRHTQAAEDWDQAARMLADHWPGLYLGGQAATTHELLGGFPAGLLSADAGLAAVAAADQLTQGSLETAERYLDLGARASTSVPEARRGQLRLLLEVVRLLLAGQRGNLPGVADEVQRLAATAGDRDAVPPGLSEDLRALALISLGSAEFWATGEDAGRNLRAGITLARRIHRPYLEFIGLAHQSAANFYGSFERSAETAKAAVEIGRLNGWSNEPAFGVACMLVGGMLVFRGQLDEAEPWVQRAERTLRAETHPVFGLTIRTLRGDLELARGQYSEAVGAFQAAERLSEQFAAPHHLVPQTRALMMHALVRLGETDRAGQVLAGLSEQDRKHAEIRIATAALLLAQGNPRAAHATLAPVLDDPDPVYWRIWLTLTYVLEAAAREALGEQAAADNAFERALDLAEPDGAVMPFLMYPAPSLLDRHARHRTAHASLLAEIRDQLPGTRPSLLARPRPLLEAPSESEIRVLRYLPTNLTGPEIARELHVSPNTVRTHLRNLYAKIGAHSRAEAVERARALGLLAPTGRGRGSRFDRTADSLT